MFNKNEFKTVLAEKGKTIAEVARMLEINESTMYRKMNGQTEFTRLEIQKICSFLETDNMMKIFFA